MQQGFRVWRLAVSKPRFKRLWGLESLAMPQAEWWQDADRMKAILFVPSESGCEARHRPPSRGLYRHPQEFCFCSLI